MARTFYEYLKDRLARLENEKREALTQIKNLEGNIAHNQKKIIDTRVEIANLDAEKAMIEGNLGVLRSGPFAEPTPLPDPGVRFPEPAIPEKKKGGKR